MILFWMAFVVLLGLFCALVLVFIFFFKQKTAYELRISDWSSDVCSSDLRRGRPARIDIARVQRAVSAGFQEILEYCADIGEQAVRRSGGAKRGGRAASSCRRRQPCHQSVGQPEIGRAHV